MALLSPHVSSCDNAVSRNKFEDELNPIQLGRLIPVCFCVAAFPCKRTTFLLLFENASRRRLYLQASHNSKPLRTRRDRDGPHELRESQ